MPSISHGSSVKRLAVMLFRTMRSRGVSRADEACEEGIRVFSTFAQHLGKLCKTKKETLNALDQETSRVVKAFALCTKGEKGSCATAALAELSYSISMHRERCCGFHELQTEKARVVILTLVDQYRRLFDEQARRLVANLPITSEDKAVHLWNTMSQGCFSELQRNITSQVLLGLREDLAAAIPSLEEFKQSVKWTFNSLLETNRLKLKLTQHANEGCTETVKTTEGTHDTTNQELKLARSKAKDFQKAAQASGRIAEQACLELKSRTEEFQKWKKTADVAHDALVQELQLERDYAKDCKQAAAASATEAETANQRRTVRNKGYKKSEKRENEAFKTLILEAELQRKHAEDSLEEAEALTRASEEARRQLDLQVARLRIEAKESKSTHDALIRELKIMLTHAKDHQTAAKLFHRNADEARQRLELEDGPMKELLGAVIW